MTMPRDEGPALARNLRSLRRVKGMSLDALAKASGISRNTIINIEQGDSNANLDTLYRLAKGLGVRASVLIEDPNEAQGELTTSRFLLELRALFARASAPLRARLGSITRLLRTRSLGTPETTK